MVAFSLIHASFVHFHVMLFVQMLLQSYSAIHKVLGASLFLSQIFVTIVTVRQMRVFSQPDMNSVFGFQVFGNAAVASQMTLAILTDGHDVDARKSEGLVLKSSQ
jgi:hypothetical protein